MHRSQTAQVAIFLEAALALGFTACPRFNDAAFAADANKQTEATAHTGAAAQPTAPAPAAPQLLWQSGHTSPINVVSFSPDGKLLASGSGSDWARLEKNVVLLWDVATGTELRMFVPGEPVDWIAFSPDGRRIAVKGSRNSSKIKVWDVVNGDELADEKVGPEYVPYPVSPDGKIAAEVDELDIHLRDIAGNQLLRTLASRTSDFQKVMFSPDSTILASGGTRLSIRLWDLRSGTLRTLVGHTAYPVCADFSPDSRLFASGGMDQTVRIWDVASGREIKKLEGHTTCVHGMKFSPDGKTLLSDDHAGLKLWEVATGRELMSVDGEFDLETKQAFFSPLGDFLVAQVGDKRVLWHVETGKELRSISVHGAFLFSPNGKILATDEGDEKVKLSDAASGKELAVFDAHVADAETKTQLHWGTFSPNSQILAFVQTVKPKQGQPSWRLHWIEVATGKLLHTLTIDENESEYTDTLVFTPDGRQIVKIDDNVIIWDVATGQQVKNFATVASLDGYMRDLWPISPRYVRDCFGVVYCPLSPNGTYYCLIGDCGELNLYNIRDWSFIACLIGVDEKDWLVATCDDFFDGSPAAWKAMYWRFNNDTFNYAPLEAFFNEFYYPGLLPDLLAGKRPQPPDGKDMSRIDRRQPKLTITSIDKPTTDATGASAKRESVTLAVEIDENANPPANSEQPATGGVRDVRLFRNGSLVKAWRGDVFSLGESEGCEEILSAAGSRRVRCTVNVPIVAGANEFTAYAFNQANVKSPDAALSLTGSDELRRKPTLHVLAVGIDKYDYQPLNLRYAVADAQGFAAEVVRQQTGTKTFANIRRAVLTDEKATKEHILGALAELAHKAQPEDTVIVYFAGHGTANDNRFYLIPHNIGYAEDRANVDDDGLVELLRRSVSDRELEEAFEKVDAAQILLVIDACNSGQALEADEKRRGPMNSKGLAQLAYEKGMYVLTAAQSFQAAQEVSVLGHGLFTYVVVEEGLKRSVADCDPPDTNVDIREWLDYATRRVPQVQLREMQLAGARGVPLAFSDNELDLDLGQRTTQRPRAFYRRETDASSLIMARLSDSAQPQDNSMLELEKLLEQSSNNDATPTKADPVAGTPDETISERGRLGIICRGPAEDLKADIVEEQNGVYHTPNSTQAVMGTYGKALKGSRMLGRLARFEQRGVVQQLDRIRRFETVHRHGKGSGKDFFSLFGSRKAWQVLNLGGKLSGGRQQEMSFEIVGVRLEQSDVIAALNADTDALNYFDYIKGQDEAPCVVLENVMLTNYAAAQTTTVGVGATAETVLSTESVKAQVDTERTTSTQLAAPVIRCYQMYQVKLHNNQVVELTALDP